MTFRLSLQSCGDYLVSANLITQSEKSQVQIEPIAAKNFNLKVSLPEGHKLLIKQERPNQEGKMLGEFWQEWRLQKFLKQFPDLDYIQSLLPKVLHFDPENYITIFDYLANYQDLANFYTKENNFSTAIATNIGTMLATIHRATFNNRDYQEFFDKTTQIVPINLVQYVSKKLERIEPEIFGMVSADVLKFITLYQRYDSLGQAMAELAEAFTPCCLTHNDLKLNNILLDNQWEQSSQNIVRLIDLERSGWGDPAFDLGTLIANYLHIWLSSLVVSNALSIEESLRLATIPIEQIQPSIAALTIAYLNNFLEIVEYRPNFLERVIQFTGFGLIQQIQSMMHQQNSFGNRGICLLQVAKSLLCRPNQSMPTIFGTRASELNRFNLSFA